MAAALEAKSEHPLARAIMKKADEQKLIFAEVSDFAAVPGNGLQAVIEGTKVNGGNREYISKFAEIGEKLSKKAAAFAEQGKTPLYFSKDDKVAGIIAVADTIKEDSREAVQQLKGMGIRVVMLTGDNERTAKAIGKQAGVDEVIADVKPDGKESVIRKLKKQGKVAMVGDGINDAPALTRADIGIAIGAGTDVAIDAADIVLMDDDITKIASIVKISRKTLRIVRQNIVFALAVKALVLILGALGMANMWEAVFADVGVSVIAILNSMRALKIDKD